MEFVKRTYDKNERIKEWFYFTLIQSVILKEYNLMVALWGLYLLKNRTLYLLLPVACLHEDLVGVSVVGISSAWRNGCMFLFRSLRFL